MDYEKAYKEALERAKTIHNEHRAQCHDIMTKVFPELAESEDERIRKALIRAIESVCKEEEVFIDGFTRKQIVSWLEKQGDKLSKYNPYKTTIESIAAMVEKYTQPDSDLQDFYNNVKVKCKDAVEYDKTFLEKQSEQTSNYNTKPKFKVKIADREYNVIEIKVSAGVTFYGIEDEPNHIDYIPANDCEIINEYGIKENSSPYPTKSATFSGYKKDLESIDNKE